MATKDMERVSHLEGAYEHMATKAELATLNGDYRVQFERMHHTFELIDKRFEAIEETMRSMQADIRGIQEVLIQIVERLDRLEARMDQIESSNARIIGFQTESRTLRDDGDDY